jgi:hypothetical protein
MKLRLLIALVVALVALVLVSSSEIRSLAAYSWNRVVGRKYTIEDRVKQFGESVRGRLRPFFDVARLHYPPERVVLVGFKDERRLQVYADAPGGGFRFVRSYPILAASGRLGPKLKEGDRQVPEGVYPIESLNPNSRFHLALRVGYPNDFDRDQAAKEGRTNLGGDIMIHGSALSIGCLAMGDEAAEDLFILAADAGLTNCSVILTPVDFRRGPSDPIEGGPPWAAALYAQIRARLGELPAEPQK